MQAARQSFRLLLTLAIAVPALGTFVRGVWPVALVFFVAGGFWLGGRRWAWVSGASFVLCVVGLVLASLLDVGLLWLLPGMIAALAAWDLDAFIVRLASVERVEHESVLVRAHLQRLGLLCAVSLLVSGVVSLMRLHLSFGLTLALALVVVVAVRFILYSLDEGA